MTLRTAGAGVEDVGRWGCSNRRRRPSEGVFLESSVGGWRTT